MKKIFKLAILGVALIGFAVVNAQIVVPDESPTAMVSQKIGFNQVTVDYVRPNARGRVIFGDAVPYGQMWLTTAKAYVQISFLEDAFIQEDKLLKAGTYSIFAIPEEQEWTLLFVKKNIPWSMAPFFYFEPKFYHESESFIPGEKEALRITVVPAKLKEQVESFTVQMANVCNTCAEVQLMWDFTRVSFRVNSEVDQKILSDIKIFTTNPEARLAGDYYVAAKYYLETDRELDKALEWINKSLVYTPEAYWVIHTKAEIQAKMGDYKGAIDTATLSLEKAKAKNDEDFVRMNTLEIAKWKELKRKNGKI